ncbi:PAAR domain-containing protein [Pseudomonas sp. EA_65y_Pfl1_P120]|uniref:PAAR domain-containing protein n=1 Tax=Pseudomonas sp. EA_65y_Pfl1_P120 TaxID=3088693 RepID=UPI0030D886B6
MSGKPAARVTDPTDGANPIVEGSGDVFFDGLPAARQGDATECGGVMSDGLATTVFINGKPAATVDSVGTHGNKVTAGSGTVIIGNSHTPAPFVAPLPVDIKWPFTEHFVVTDPETGKPVVDRAYTIRTDSGKEITGVTDGAGKTSVVGFSIAEGVTLLLEPQSSIAIY